MSVAISKGKLDANLTREQNECVDSKSKDLLIKGVAGSGKTLVLLRKVIQLKNEAIKNNKNIRIGFFTYANTLTKYSKDLIEQIMCGDESEDMITISTFHSYAWKLMKSVDNTHYKTIYPGLSETKLKTCISKHKEGNKKNRVYDLDLEFWMDEISWIKGKRILSREQYINGDRTGRGSSVRLNKSAKEIVYDIYEAYNKSLKRGKYIEFNDVSNIVLDKVNLISESQKFDYVLVDEAQDLSYSQLALLKAIAKEGIIIAADHAQKIYKNSFTWSDLGINVRGNASKTLNKSFRSTKQIIELSHSLIKNNKGHKGKDTEYTIPVLPNDDGEIPIVFKCKNKTEECKVLISLLDELNDGESIIGIPYRSKKERYFISKILQEQGISFEEVDKENRWSLLEPGVKLVTMHSAKGLEFDIVIIPMVNQGIIPKEADSDDKDDDFLEGERSLLYVAMTRARNELYILTSKESQFILELDEKLYEVSNI